MIVPVSAISWLSNDEFLIVYTPTASVYQEAPESTFHLVTRQKPNLDYMFQKVLDPSPPFGLNRFPPFHFIQRLMNFPPSLLDMLIVSSTCSSDIGLLTKSESPLSSDLPVGRITNTYTATSLALDHRRAQLPYSEDMGDTSPIGMTIDLSSRDMVKRPIPGDEMEESTTPLPALMVLNHEGLLSAWWIVYNDSVRQGAAYPGLVAVSGAPNARPATATSPPTANAQSTVGAPMSRPMVPSFGQSSSPGLGMNRQSVWGTTNNTGAAQTGGSAFGQPAFGQPAFGQPSQPTATFGQPSQPRPTFGSSSQLGASSGNAAFGSATALGGTSSPWATSNTSGDANSKPANPFGGSNALGSSPFGKLGEKKPTPTQFSSSSSTSPFASFGQKPALSSFSSFANSNNQNKPPGMTPEPSFGSTVDLGSTNSASSFGQPSTFGSGLSAWGTPSTMSSAFAAQPAAQAQSQEMEMGDDSISTQKPVASSISAFGLGQGGFKLDSGFTGDGTATDDLPKPKDPAGGLFSMGLGDALSNTQKAPTTPIKEEPEEPKLSDISTTPASPPKPAQTPNVAAPPIEKPMPAPSDDAPLPPDPTSAKYKAKQLEMNANMPPGVGTPKAQSPAPEDAVPKSEDLPPLAGSPPVDLGEGSSPLSDVSDENLDHPKEIPTQPTNDSTPAIKETLSFTPDSKPPQETQGHEAQRLQQPSTTPFAFKPAAANFPPPTTRPIASPRSPSPTRNFTTPAAPSGKPLVPPLGGSRPPSRPTSRNERPVSRSSLFNASGVPRRDSGSRTPQPSTQSQPQQPKPKIPEPEPEPEPEPKVSDLRDEEDERIRKLLESEVEPTRTLDPFIAHQDYAGLEEKTGLLGQMERIYRDINSMLDTLGLNARALQCWIEGQHAFTAASPRSLDDDDDDDWTLVELPSLASIQHTLTDTLTTSALTHVPDKIQDLASLHHDVHRLRARTRDLRTTVDAHTNPARLARARIQPLSAEQGQQQVELRRGVARVQAALLEAEDGVAVLRAKVAASAEDGGSGAPSAAAPTVEAVRRTIAKMTAMVERKHSDVTVLEVQMRKLRRGLAALSLDGAADGLRGGGVMVKSEDDDAGASPFLTPPSQQLRESRFAAAPLSASSSSLWRTPELRRSAMPGTYALEYSPSNGSASVQSSPMVRRQLGASALGVSMRSSPSTATPRKKMSGVSEEDVVRFNGRVEARKRVLVSLREAVEKKGVRETKLED